MRMVMLEFLQIVQKQHNSIHSYFPTREIFIFYGKFHGFFMLGADS